MPHIQRWGLSGASTSVSETTCRLSSTRSGGRGRLRHRARSISQVGRRSWAPKVHAGRPDACFPGQASAWGSRAHAIAWDENQAFFRPVPTSLHSAGSESPQRHRGGWSQTTSVSQKWARLDSNQVPTDYEWHGGRRHPSTTERQPGVSVIACQLRMRSSSARAASSQSFASV
jgi:hypothetical protein